MQSPELKNRTKEFAKRVLRVVRSLPQDRISDPIARQIIRSGTSVGANYRAACFAKSRKDFINKIRIALEEVDETNYWLEIIAEENILPADKLSPLQQEASELTNIFLASLKTARTKE